MTVRALKGLEEVVGLSVVDPIRDLRGWAFREAPGATGDPINGFEYLSEAYERSLPGYDDRYSVPVLWDTESGQIVNNESSEIIVMLNGAFNEWAAHPEVELYPQQLRGEIDEINDWVYTGLNNGAYRVGFAASQEAYDEAIGPLFETLDRMDALLARPALPRRLPAHARRLARVPDADALRPRLPRALPVQSPPAGRLRQSLALSPRSLPDAPRR